MHILYFFAFIFLLYGCAEEQPVETIDMEDLLPKSKKEKEVIEEEVTEKEISPLEIALTELDDSYIMYPDSAKGSYFPDRLRYESREGGIIYKDTHAYELAIWEFADSLQTVNAFYNWLDCFGAYCESVKVGERKYLRDKSSKLIWISNHRIFYVKANEGFGNISLWENLAENYLSTSAWNIKLIKNPRVIMKWEMPKVD